MNFLFRSCLAILFDYSEIRILVGGWLISKKKKAAVRIQLQIRSNDEKF